MKIKRLVGCLYCVILMRPFHKIFYAMNRAKKYIEKDYLMFCQAGCDNCYRWRCEMRTNGKTPYKKFRRDKEEAKP